MNVQNINQLTDDKEVIKNNNKVKKIMRDIIAPIVGVASIATLYLGIQWGLYSLGNNRFQILENKQGIEKTVANLRNSSPPPIIAYTLYCGYFKARHDYLQNNKEHWK
ncbi:MAG: hypothetical protein AB7V77_00995 [Candidatus Woesearchaeota archaeon]